MPEVTPRRVGDLQRGVFKILLDHPEGMPAKDILLRMEQLVPPTDFERSDYPNNPGVQRFPKMIRFATIAPVKAGWMIKEKGKWYLTDEGRKAYAQFPDPEEFRQESRRLYHQWWDNQPDNLPELDDSQVESKVLGGDVAASSTYEEAEENAWSEIEKYIQAMNPYDLQKLVAALLRAMGYFVSWISPPGPDKGIDILAHTDPLGTQNPRIKVQVKRRADAVDVAGLRSFLAVLGDQDVGIFVCTGGFTSEAQSEARTKETRKLTVIDLERLVELWIQHYKNVAESEKALLPLKPVYYLAPSE